MINLKNIQWMNLGKSAVSGVSGFFNAYKIIIFYVAVTAVVYLFTMRLVDVWVDRMAEKEAKETALQQLKLDLATLSSELVTTNELRNFEYRMNEDQEHLFMQIMGEMYEIKQKQIESAKIFEEHDLADLAKKKGGLIQTRANRATQEKINELQNVINGTATPVFNGMPGNTREAP